jgi:hypothetical protein
MVISDTLYCDYCKNTCRYCDICNEYVSCCELLGISDHGNTASARRHMSNIETLLLSSHIYGTCDPKTRNIEARIRTDRKTVERALRANGTWFEGLDTFLFNFGFKSQTAEF